VFVISNKLAHLLYLWSVAKCHCEATASKQAKETAVAVFANADVVL
jgi:hypothetical protein